MLVQYQNSKIHCAAFTNNKVDGSKIILSVKKTLKKYNTIYSDLLRTEIHSLVFCPLTGFAGEAGA